MLDINSTFSGNVDIEFEVDGTNGTLIRTLATNPDHPDQGQELDPPSGGYGSNLTIQPGDHTYVFPPRFQEPGASNNNQADLLPTGPQWCIRSFIFLIPGNSEDDIVNGVDPDNSLTACYTAKETKLFRVLYVPFTTQYDQMHNFPVVTCDDMKRFSESAQRFLRQAYPVQEFSSQYAARFEDNLWLSSTTRCTPDVYPTTTPWGFTDFELAMKHLADLRGFDYDQVVAVVRNGFIGSNIGVPSAAGIAPFAEPQIHAAVVEADAPSTLTAQEVAHTFSWVTHGDPLECPDAQDAGHLCSVPAPGFSVEDRQHVPDSTIDFMHPVAGSPRWVSPETWNYLLGRFKTDPDPMTLYLRGIIFADGTSQFDPWFVGNAQPDIPLGQSGDYTITYFGADGSSLGSTGFDTVPLRSTHGGPDPLSTIFSLRIPYIDNASRIVVKHAGQTLVDRSVSPNPPTVTVTAPNGGELRRPGEPVDVRWAASDPDPNTTLTYTVSLSSDGGRTWTPLAIDLTGTEFAFAMPPNVLSTSLLVRVMASDGVNTNSDVSNGTFSSTMDITAPTVTGVPDRPADSQAGWYNHSVTVTWTGDDHSGSGIASCDPPATYAGPDSAVVTLTGSCTDEAGNTALGAFRLKYDATSPTIGTNDEGISLLLHQASPRPHFTCADVTSGIASCVPSVTTLGTDTVGPRTYTVSARDNAGNEQQLIVHYNVIYRFVGISPPSPSVKVKQGSTVPVKFRLLDANSVPIGTARATVWVDGQPAMSVSNPKGGNICRYDSQAQQYVFDLSTKTLSIGSHQLIILLDDGTSHSFLLTITK
jgi:hypothetical protein